MKYDTPVYYQIKKKKYYGQKCMQDIEKLIKHHDFPEEGTLSLTRLKVVRDSVEQGSNKQPGCCCKCVKNVCKKCEQTVDGWLKEVDCWLKEADKREKMKSVTVYLYACLHHQNRLTHSMFVYVCVSHMKIR